MGILEAMDLLEEDIVRNGADHVDVDRVVVVLAERTRCCHEVLAATHEASRCDVSLVHFLAVYRMHGGSVHDH